MYYTLHFTYSIIMPSKFMGSFAMPRQESGRVSTKEVDVQVVTEPAPKTMIMSRPLDEKINNPCVSCVLTFTVGLHPKLGCKTLTFPLCVPFGYCNQIVCPCVCSTLGNTLTLLTCDQICCSCFKYGKVDCVFPPCLTSVGCLPSLQMCTCLPHWMDPTIGIVGCCCTSWAPLPKVAEASGIKTSGEQMQLFKDGISPRDIVQGAVGDCWLLAAFAAAAEQPLIIQHCFIEKKAQASGLYHVRLYDGPSQSWRTVAVDHRVPKLGERFLSTTPNGAELWVSLLEKATAKFRGSYAGMDGGYTAWALEALTGQPAQIYQKDHKDTNTWNEQRVQYFAAGSRQDTLRKDTGLKVNGADELWHRLTFWEKNNYLMCCGCNKDEKGLMSGHAYTLLAAFEKNGKRAVQLRNPHGKSEWTGEFADSSDDGIFTMPFDEFRECFFVITAINPKVKSLPSNEQLLGNIGAACKDQCFTTKRFFVDSFRYICCCAGFIQHNPYMSECLAGCGPCFKPCWSRQGIYTRGYDGRGGYTAVEEKEVEVELA